MHCSNNNFCVVKHTEPTVYHNNKFKSKWTQQFQNTAKQEFLLINEQYKEEKEEKEEKEKQKFPLTYDGLMQWHQNDKLQELEIDKEY